MKQGELFSDKPKKSKPKEQENGWQKEWKEMPEFIQVGSKPYAQIIFRFETKEDLDNFSKLIGQKLTEKTKSAWHPHKSHWGMKQEAYIAK